jgi:hypothetical protein
MSVDQWAMPRILRRPWRARITALVALLALLVAQYAGVPLTYGDVVGWSYHAVFAGSTVACLLRAAVTRRERWPGVRRRVWGDLAMLVLVVAVLTLAGWRVEPRPALPAAGFVAAGLVDSWYLLATVVS